MAITRKVDTDVYCDICGKWVMGWTSNNDGVSRAWAAKYARKKGCTVGKKIICKECRIEKRIQTCSIQQKIGSAGRDSDGTCMNKLIKHTDFAGLDVLPANMRLLSANQAVMLDQTRPQQFRIRDALECVKNQYDFCIIDNAPDINVSTINALTACDDVLIPVEIDDNTTEGLPELVSQIGYTKEDLNKDLENFWIFITKYDRRNEAQRQGLEMIQAAGYPMLKTKIRYSRKVSESTYARIPIPLYSPRSLAAKDYEDLVNEYITAVKYAKEGEED